MKRSIANLSRKAEESYTKAILAGTVTPAARSPYLARPNTMSWQGRKDYIPSRDNPQHSVRPGADDHLRYVSKGAEAQAIYHDRGHV